MTVTYANLCKIVSNDLKESPTEFGEKHKVDMDGVAKMANDIVGVAIIESTDDKAELIERIKAHAAADDDLATTMFELPYSILATLFMSGFEIGWTARHKRRPRG